MAHVGELGPIATLGGSGGVGEVNRGRAFWGKAVLCSWNAHIFAIVPKDRVSSSIICSSFIG